MLSSSLSSVLGVAVLCSLDLPLEWVHTTGDPYRPEGRTGGSSVWMRSRRAENSRYEGRGNGTGRLSGGWVAGGACHAPAPPAGRDEEAGLRLAPALGRRFLTGEVDGGEQATSAQEGE